MISKDSLVQLKNPEGNEVYLKYTVSEGDTVIYESDYISPGESVAWHAGEDLEGLGEHDLSFFVSTLSVSTLEPKNTATILVKANVD